MIPRETAKEEIEMKKLSLVTVCVFCLFWLVGGAFAATATQDLTVNATVAATAKLTISPTTISFPDADPDVTNPIPATGGAVTVTVKAKTGSSSSVTLTHKAADDLKDVAKTIPISNVTWTAAGAGYVAGTMNKTTGQAVGTWTGSGTYPGTLTFTLVNDWAYETGSYSALTTFTLTAP